MTEAAHSTALRPLTAAEARVLGTLMEKARTVPDSYPMTLNGIVSGCNQKTSRDVTMNLSDSQAQEALDELKHLGLVFESSGSRVARYEHNTQRRLGVPEQSAVLLGLLMLRGPQTAGELRINAERWYRFADISSVEGFLDELQARADHKGGPLVVCLPRAPGAREQRWAQLLCGPVESGVEDHHGATRAAEDSALLDRVDQLEQQVAQLRRAMAFLVDELGLKLPVDTAADGASPV